MLTEKSSRRSSKLRSWWRRYRRDRKLRRKANAYFSITFVWLLVCSFYLYTAWHYRSGVATTTGQFVSVISKQQVAGGKSGHLEVTAEYVYQVGNIRYSITDVHRRDDFGKPVTIVYKTANPADAEVFVGSDPHQEFAKWLSITVLGLLGFYAVMFLLGWLAGLGKAKKPQ